MDKLKWEHRQKVDEYNNRILIKSNGKQIILSLQLAEETKKRRVGAITVSTKTLTVYRKPHHLLYKANAYGFNYQLLHDAKKFNHVKIITDDGDFKIPRLDLLDKGQFLFFKQQGFERQIFIGLLELEKYRVNPSF